MFFISNNSYSEDDLNKALRVLKDFDKEINELTISIRQSDISWNWEIITNNQTNTYQRSYLELKAGLDSMITFATQESRERVAKLKTMGQALSSIPTLVSDMMTIVDYETRLNHIEFLITSRSATLSARRSILIAFLFGFFSLCLGVFSVIRSASINKRFKEIDQQYEKILSRLKRSRRFLSHSSSLSCKHRRLIN